MCNSILTLRPGSVRGSKDPIERLSLIRPLSALILLFCIEFQIYSQGTDYRIIFGSDWEKAEEFVIKNKQWMKQISDRFDVSLPVAVAVVFPELIRYSALRDRMELAILKTLYINLGDEYADFSVGQFQMKPSFAETINNNAGILKGRLGKFFPDPGEYVPEWKYRSAVVKYLENTQSQYLYLVAFVKICEKSFDLSNMDEEKKIKFLSTAYNYSFRKSYAEITSMADRKFFTTKLVTKEYYSYSDISLFWYRLHKAEQTHFRSGKS